MLLLWYFDKTMFRDVLNQREAKFDIIEKKKNNYNESNIDKVNDVELLDKP